MSRHLPPPPRLSPSRPFTRTAACSAAACCRCPSPCSIRAAPSPTSASPGQANTSAWWTGTYSLSPRTPTFLLPGPHQCYLCPRRVGGVSTFDTAGGSRPSAHGEAARVPPHACPWATDTLLKLQRALPACSRSYSAFSLVKTEKLTGSHQRNRDVFRLPPSQIILCLYFRGADALPQPTGTVCTAPWLSSKP